MRLARLGPSGRETPVVIQGGRALDLSPITADIDGGFLATGGVEQARRAVQAGTLAELPDAARMRVGPPVARPSAVYAIGMNYAAHAAETGAPPPEHLVMFLKAPNAMAGPDDAVEIPPGAARMDWEVELAVVIGTRATRLRTPEDARAHVAGFALANDVSEREWQLSVSGGQWSKGKSAPGFLPLGPWLVTPDEIDADDVRLRSWVNGQPRQDSRTSDLIFGIDRIVWDLSRHVTLEPGDVVLTGTPQGVALSGRFPYLAAGDTVALEIDGLGRQRQLYVAAPDEG